MSGRNQANSCCCSSTTMMCMNSDKKACCFSSGIYQFYLASQATLTWPHLAWPPPHITLGAALDNNNLIRLISRCGQGEIIVVIALLHSPVIAFVYHRTMPRPQQPVSGRPGSRAAQYRAADVWTWGKWSECVLEKCCVFNISRISCNMGRQSLPG